MFGADRTTPTQVNPPGGINVPPAAQKLFGLEMSARSFTGRIAKRYPPVICTNDNGVVTVVVTGGIVSLWRPPGLIGDDSRASSIDGGSQISHSQVSGQPHKATPVCKKSDRSWRGAALFGRSKFINQLRFRNILAVIP